MSLEFPNIVKNLTATILSEVYELPVSYFLDNNKNDNNFLSLHWPKDKLVLGYHGRHQHKEMNEEEERKFDGLSLDCLYHDSMELIRQANNDKEIVKECIIIVATDRQHTIDTIEIFSNDKNCKAYHISHEDSNAVMRNEHGPWGDSYYSTADIYLASHSQYFLGLKSSTFSMLIADIVAARHYISYNNNNNGSNNSTTPDMSEFLWDLDDKHFKCSHFIDKTIPQVRVCGTAYTYDATQKEFGCIA